MANILSSWRSALVSALATQFPNADVGTGVRVGVSRDKDRIRVFADPVEQGHLGDRIVVGTPRLIVRYWKQQSIQPPPDTPADPTELEQARFDLETFLETKQASLGVSGLWFFQIESVKIDEDPNEWGIEAKLVGFTKNYAAIA